MSASAVLFALSLGAASTDVPETVEATVWAPRAQLEMFYAQAAGPASATPLVLLHPWGLDHRVWTSVLPALAADRSVILVDLPAHGRSDRSHVRWSMTRLGRAVLDVLDAAGVERAIVAGNSLGGATSLEVARQAPDRVEGLILVAAPGGRRLAAPLRQLARQVVTTAHLSTLSDQAWSVGLWLAGRGGGAPIASTTEALLEERRDLVRWRAFSRSAGAVLQAVADYAPPLDTVRSPALVVHGDADPLITQDLSQALAHGLPRGRLVVLEDCGHMPELECPNALLEVVGPFIARLDDASDSLSKARLR